MNELKRLLITKIKPTDWQKIANKFPVTDLRCKHINWEDDSNVHYRDAVQSICTALTKAFPIKINMEKITACKQKSDEDPDEYLTRLTEIFNTHSGLQIPDETGNTPDVWEIHLSNCFLSGLKPSISSAVKISCIGWKDARLSELRRHAIHAFNKKEKKESTEKELHLATMTMLNATREHTTESNHKDWKTTQNRRQVRSPRPTDVCHRCGQHGHWSRNCPAPNPRHSD